MSVGASDDVDSEGLLQLVMICCCSWLRVIIITAALLFVAAWKDLLEYD
jgi:hypothetical protein